ncbi:uncharacterized protein LAESUDRAFT_644782 [Laetiporus sulphureus 93-53]|uniref:Aminoglycoside phosphotransferase domain-containing protein n=1 Tax=Laetiporus sulphureus 93-53 TaxID=1314785 RepID=A0A165GIW3_9APHY|nr:uncharacterized protein LAESUDRAFT_644782 [Laetiporus sulphureus 93-53]KZT10409.1 hypothetical protein LAESUDRAFT_644782 [Laetiporus sulphureus 93-53]
MSLTRLLRHLPLLKSASRHFSITSNVCSPPGTAVLAVAGQVTTDQEALRRHTSNRWLYNEQIQLSRRYVKFDPHALGQVASGAVGANCTRIDKVAEGSTNKIFLLTFENGQEAIARLPCPLAGPPHLITASEVATMEFAREIMKIPVPKILSWSSRADATPVGAEFIIMEKVHGVELEKLWPEMRGAENKTVVEQLMEIQKKFMTFRFSHYGSLFFKEDVVGYPHTTDIFAEPTAHPDVPSKYAIGPCVSWDLWRGERQRVDVDRGPWKDAYSYIAGFVKCEKQWLARFAKPRDPSDPFYLDPEDNSPAAHIAVLDQFLACLPHIMPDPELRYPALWHTDLHRGNIFVEPPQPTISGIIDWQWTDIGPFYAQAIFPKAFVYGGDRIKLSSNPYDRPQLPEGFEDLPLEEQELARMEHNEAFTMCYQQILITETPPWSAVTTIPHRSTIVDPVYRATRTWYGGIVSMQIILLHMQVVWDEIAPAGTSCPLNYTNEDAERLVSLAVRARDYENNVERLKTLLNVQIDGRVDTEQYDEVRAKSEEMKAHWDPEECGGQYPFQEGGHSLLI